MLEKIQFVVNELYQATERERVSISKLEVLQKQYDDLVELRNREKGQIVKIVEENRTMKQNEGSTENNMDKIINIISNEVIRSANSLRETTNQYNFSILCKYEHGKYLETISDSKLAPTLYKFNYLTCST